MIKYQSPVVYNNKNVLHYKDKNRSMLGREVQLLFGNHGSHWSKCWLFVKFKDDTSLDRHRASRFLRNIYLT